MDWQALRAGYPQDRDVPIRARRILALERVLDGSLYDDLTYSFGQERQNGSSGEYVPLSKRRPSVRTHLCRVVVDDAVSLLFSEGHWPSFRSKDRVTGDVLTQLCKDLTLNETMIQAATIGSTGSVCLLLRFLDNAPTVDVMSTAYMTPAWDPKRPKDLLRVTERYKVKGSDLRAAGYGEAEVPAADAGVNYWFQREWGPTEETWYLPLKIDANGTAAQSPVRDESRSVVHGLGFVPCVWIRNLPSLRPGHDGACTFELGIDTMIESDYLWSQGGRALKYASDPTLVITQGVTPQPENGTEGSGGTPVPDGGAGTAMVLGSDSDAKLLEINGASAKAISEHQIQLRAIALEIMHGNRSAPDKLSAATSGRSIELMMSCLIWLADRMRTSYGERGLLAVLRMMCLASTKLERGIEVDGELVRDLDPKGLELRWAPWFPATPDDCLTAVEAVATATASGNMSQEAGVTYLSGLFSLDDVAGELAKIEADKDAVDSRANANADLAAARTPPAAGPGGGATAIRAKGMAGKKLAAKVKA